MSNRIPTYRLHKPSGRAVVTISGKDHYLGPYGTAESRQKYGEIIARHAAGLEVEIAEKPLATLSVGQLVLAYMRFAAEYYKKDGQVTDEYDCLKSAACPLVQLYGETEAEEFTALGLKAVRQKMIDNGWCRVYINKSVGRIRRMFRHAVSNDMIGPAVLQKLESVPPLLEGRTTAKEKPRRSAVPQDNIEAVRQAVNELTRDMIDLALLTGARPGELVSLTGEMLDRSEEIWTAQLTTHKMQHRDRRRVIAFGPRSQLILRKYLKADPALRLFPIVRSTFSNRIKAACEALGLPRFTAHWLRHNAATELRREAGLDGAQIVLGHSKADTTELYAHLDDSRLKSIALQRG